MKPLPLEIRFAFRKHMIINREFEPLLRKNGLDHFDTIMKFNEGEVVKQKNKNRSTIRFYLPDGEDNVLLYLKRYRFPLIPEVLKNYLTFSRTYSAFHEWRNILAFKSCNLPTMTPIAVGMRRLIPFWNESFLLTQGIRKTKTLERELKESFVLPLDRVRLKQKMALIDKLASLAQQVHSEGFQHQDFYLCHILINSNDPENPLLYIADLHRLRRNKKSNRRWKIKDLAGINYSAPKELISRTDRIRFLQKYDPVLARDRSFIKAILKKTERIRNHEEKRGNKNFD